MSTFLDRNKEVIAHLLVIIGLSLVCYQLYQSNEHKKWENYNAMNLRYYEWYSNMPPKIDTCVQFTKQESNVKRWVRTYFNLYSEEYWLYLEGLIPEEMWTKRINNGVNVNLKKYPVLIQGYKYWKEEDSFMHPNGFRNLVDVKLESINDDLRLKDCKSSKVPNTKEKLKIKKTQNYKTRK